MQDVIARHKTAISRTELSRPVKTAIADGLLSPERQFFDYGCGLGDDLRLLNALGYDGQGWDPIHRADGPQRKSAIVNLGYVVNVIERPDERQDALKRAWSLATEALIVSARLTLDGRYLGESQDYADGLLTARGTFQKFFDQQELRNWIDHTLGVVSVPAAPGVFYVFRDEQTRSAFVASRYRRRQTAPRLTRSAELFRTHAALLQTLIDFISERGRAPDDEEIANAPELISVFGSVKRACRVIFSVTDKDQWAEITRKRREDLLIYLALTRFGGRPIFSRLSRPLQGDVKGLFGNYKQACAKADELLYSLGKPGVTDAALRSSSLGKLTPNALYIHESALNALSPLLRLYEGCAQAYLGKVDGANVIKLHLGEPRISYLAYPAFETEGHPALASSMTVQLQTFRVNYRDYRSHQNAPILHRKELFVAPDHPMREKFARLTRLEKAKGLYEQTDRIGLQDGWNEALKSRGLYLKGHRLLSRASAQ